MNKLSVILTTAALIGMTALAACSSSADIASKNLSTAADNFEINRRVVFYNGITGEYIQTIEGLCSIDNLSTENKISITCKTGPNEYKKSFFYRSDNNTVFVEQLDPAPVNTYQYRVIFKPLSIIPTIEIK